MLLRPVACDVFVCLFFFFFGGGVIRDLVELQILNYDGVDHELTACPQSPGQPEGTPRSVASSTSDSDCVVRSITGERLRFLWLPSCRAAGGRSSMSNTVGWGFFWAECVAGGGLRFGGRTKPSSRRLKRREGSHAAKSGVVLATMMTLRVSGFQGMPA